MTKDAQTEGWLTGWKRIAAHIGLNEQTAKVLHKRHGLPVRQLPSGQRVALPSELDAWLKQFSHLPSNLSHEK